MDAAIRPAQASPKQVPKDREHRSDDGVSRAFKTCTSCHKSKAANAFAKKGGRRDSRCKECKNMQRRARYEALRKVRKPGIATNRIAGVVEVRTGDDQTVADGRKVLEQIFTDIAMDMISEGSRHGAGSGIPQAS